MTGSFQGVQSVPPRRDGPYLLHYVAFPDNHLPIEIAGRARVAGTHVQSVANAHPVMACAHDRMLLGTETRDLKFGVAEHVRRPYSCATPLTPTSSTK